MIIIVNFRIHFVGFYFYLFIFVYLFNNNFIKLSIRLYYYKSHLLVKIFKLPKLNKKIDKIKIEEKGNYNFLCSFKNFFSYLNKKYFQ